MFGWRLGVTIILVYLFNFSGNIII